MIRREREKEQKNTKTMFVNFSTLMCPSCGGQILGSTFSSILYFELFFIHYLVHLYGSKRTKLVLGFWNTQNKIQKHFFSFFYSHMSVLWRTNIWFNFFLNIIYWIIYSSNRTIVRFGFLKHPLQKFFLNCLYSHVSVLWQTKI